MGTFYGHLLPWPLERFEAEHFLPYSQYYSDACMLVNLQGRRFVDETLGDEILNQLLVRQPDARGVLIFDEHVRRTLATSEPFPGLGALDRVSVAIEAGGQHVTENSLNGLLSAIQEWDVDTQALGETLAAYRFAIEAGGGTPGGVPVCGQARFPTQGPFYALMVQPSVTFTFGGIRVGADMAVRDHDGQSIPGLFAAGADIGGLSNLGYAGGLAPAYITGRRAGRSAVAARTGTGRSRASTEPATTA